MRAMAFMVSPVRPSVRFIPVAVFSGIGILLSDSWQRSGPRIFGGGARSPRHDDTHSAESIAEPAALAFHELSRARALKAFGYHLELGISGVSQLAGSHFYDFGTVILSQPGCQFPFHPFSVRDAESHGLGRPPNWNAGITDELAAVEQHAGIGAAEKLPALGTALDPKQNQGANHVVEIVLNPRQRLRQSVFCRIMRCYVRNLIT